ncbi:hypothetical protein L484_013908 [Morus notabilis]|uniref:Uncharacterized protein n=1 Tax=Morus notabilis TaxID=981085 RepID=W9QR78_9ROSA|nr:hypothetical protein L484_013908 [Morus notabilis]
MTIPLRERSNGSGGDPLYGWLDHKKRFCPSNFFLFSCLSAVILTVWVWDYWLRMRKNIRDSRLKRNRGGEVDYRSL